MTPLHNAPYDPKDMTMTFHKYSDEELDSYGSLVGCERKENESNDAYRDRVDMAYERATSIAPIDDMHEKLDELMSPWITCTYTGAGTKIKWTTKLWNCLNVFLKRLRTSIFGR